MRLKKATLKNYQTIVVRITELSNPKSPTINPSACTQSITETKVCPHLSDEWILAAKGWSRTRGVSRLDTQTSGINTKNGSCRAPEKKDDIEEIEPQLLAETTRPPLHATIVTHHSSGNGIKTFARKHSVFLDEVAQHEKWWKGVGELQDASCSDEAGEIANLREGGGDNESDSPVDGYDGYPGNFTSVGHERWEAEEIH